MKTYTIKKSEDTEKVKGRVSGKFIEFMREFGDNKVSNPNPKSRKRFPEVKVISLSNSKEGQEVLKKMFKDWLGKTNSPDQAKAPKNSPLKELPPIKKPRPEPKLFLKVSEKDIDTYTKDNPEIFSEIKSYLSKTSEDEIEKQVEKLVSSQSFDVVFSKEEKKAAVVGLHVAPKVSEKLRKKFGFKYSETLGRNGDWGESSFRRSSAMIQGVLARQGIKGNLSSGDDKYVAERRAYHGAKEDENYQYPSRTQMGSPLPASDVEKILVEMYKATQAIYRELGVNEVTVFRGVKRQLDGEPPKVGDTISIESRELSSWTINPETSERFGRIISAKVPVEQVLGGFLTDPSYDWEMELMILESTGIEATVMSPHKD